jgi:hypothetical protein
VVPRGVHERRRGPQCGRHETNKFWLIFSAAAKLCRNGACRNPNREADAAVAETKIVPGRRMQLYRHLSDLRTRLLLRARRSVTGDDLVHKADACAKMLAEAQRLVAEGRGGERLDHLLRHAGALLDELDEVLLVLAHDEDQAVFAQLDLLRRTLNDLEKVRGGRRSFSREFKRYRSA